MNFVVMMDSIQLYFTNTPNASFVEYINADSLDLVELIMSLEEEFNIQISEEDAEKITTVAEAEDYIEEHVH